jgi:hypothetical protein
MTLYDSETGERIGPATTEQEQASLAAPNPEGHILIAADGRVVEQGTWDADQSDTRKCYVQMTNIEPTDV